MMRYSFTILVLLLFASTVLQGRHIIGGVIDYECLGNGDYRFTMNIYRDCNCTMCADFDPVAFVAIYRCNDPGNCSGFGQNDWFMRVDAPLLDTMEIEAPDYPCLIPPDICVEQGFYQFVVNLPPSNQSYHISYQRCCRNVTINNIINPEDSGATYTAEISPFAQQNCNNSPVFNQFPPTVICAGAPLEFDHSASDADGDELVYEFCNPLLGGGPLLDDINYQTCAGANPTPACPPPYDPVTFINPTYSTSEPMGGNPVITIDPVTGLITGTPDLLGQYVVGVCVSEFRNGQLIGTTYRDFQFNVADCDPTVVATIQADEVIDGQDFVVNACGQSDVPFINQSFQQQFIDQYEWVFEIEDEAVSFDEWSPTVSFPDTGLYMGQLILNPGSACGDTANIFVNVLPDLQANFSFDYDTCVAGPVDFTDLSISEAGEIQNWTWDFGDGSFSEEQNPSHLYMDPGNIPVTLSVQDINDCVVDTTINISYFPVPALLVISPTTFLGCAPGEVAFDNLSFPIDDTYDIIWDFGDGNTSGSISPTNIYQDPGVYTVSLDITSPIGCQTDTVFQDWITILPSPTAGFDFTPDQPSSLEPTVTFSDESSGAISWFWDFGTGVTTNARNPIYTYPDTGMFQVMQVVTHPSGCTDTLLQLIDIRPEIRYFLPNAFTPNGDTKNDTFKGVGVMEGATNFELSIWNRWGERIFITSDPEEGWNGRKSNSGELSPNGVYIVTVRFTGPRGEDYELKGLATLIR